MWSQRNYQIGQRLYLCILYFNVRSSLFKLPEFVSKAEENKNSLDIRNWFCSLFLRFIFVLFIFQLATSPSEWELILTTMSGTVLLRQTWQLCLNKMVLLVELLASNLHITKFPVRFPIFWYSIPYYNHVIQIHICT